MQIGENKSCAQNQKQEQFNNTPSLGIASLSAKIAQLLEMLWIVHRCSKLKKKTTQWFRQCGKKMTSTHR